MAEPRSLGSVIRARRQELGWTQEELAERISAAGHEVRQSEISRLERGAVSLPRRQRLERIAAALGLSLGELLASSGWAGADSQNWTVPDESGAAQAPVGRTPSQSDNFQHPLERHELPDKTGIESARQNPAVDSLRRAIERSREIESRSAALIRKATETIGRATQGHDNPDADGHRDPDSLRDAS